MAEFTVEEVGALKTLVAANLKKTNKEVVEGIYSIECQNAQVTYESVLKAAKSKRDAAIAALEA